MSWKCVGCSEQEADNNEVMGFGLCKECQTKARIRAALAKAKLKKFKFHKR